VISKGRNLSYKPRKAEVLVKAEEPTNPEYGMRPEERPIPELLRLGVINLDKPEGPTSHEIVAWVKRILEVKKAGHGGTLDPKVTGVLPIALNDATKVMPVITHLDKEYVCVATLHKDVDEEKLRKALKEFLGPIYQRPPLRSSVKRVVRVREVYSIELLEKRERNLLLRIHCQAGTYVRKIVHDLGVLLGTGAHMRELRRVRSGPFTEEEHLVTLQDVVDAYVFYKEEGEEKYMRSVILPVEHWVVKIIPKVVIRDSAVDAVCHGAKLTVPGILRLDADIKVGDTVAIMTQKGELVALGKALMNSDEMFNATRGFAVKTDRVLMKPGTYPKMWKSKKSAAS